KNTLRIVRTGGALPADRESAFWLNVKAIPGTPKTLQGKNSVQFAYVLRVKMFYRPAGLTGEPGSALDALRFARQGDQLRVTNPSAYYVTFSTLRVGGKEVKDTSTMVSPLGSADYRLPPGVTGHDVSFKALNDFGGLYPEKTASF
ncbi:TPA: molecular chaperone, partial [Yersinia enterocolitica]